MRGGERDDHRRQQGGGDNVVRRRRQPHAEDQREQRSQEQHAHERAERKLFDDIGERLADAGQAYRADDDAGHRRGDRDAEHVAPAQLQAGVQIATAVPHRAGQRPFTKPRDQRALRDEHETEEDAGIESGQAG